VVYVVDTESNESFVGKLNVKSIPFTVIDEYSFDHGIQDMDRLKFDLVINMKRSDLHVDPKVLRQKIEDQILFHINICSNDT
jgi:hypothetical protein